MLRVLTLSTLFPHALRPTFGIFVERQARGLAAHGDVELKVAAPVGLPAWPFRLHPHYAPLARLPRRETWRELDVLRPRFRAWPGPLAPRSAGNLASALAPVLADLRRDFPFDVIDAQFFWPDGPAAVRLGRELGVPVSIKARGSDIHLWSERPGIREQIIEAGRAADGLLAVSGPMRDSMVALGMPAKRIMVHHTGVDQQAFRPVDRAEAKAALGLEGPLLVCAGGMTGRKGQDVAVEALADLPGATLWLVGDGPDRRRIETLVQRLALGDRVRFLGTRPHDELPGLLAAADVMVLPSESEGLANVWVEALACGTPVVTTDVGGAREVIDRPEAGRITERTAGAVAAAVRELLAAPPPTERVRAAADRFTWERNRDLLFDHLSRLAGRAGA